MIALRWILGAAVLVLAAVAGALLLIGSPSKATPMSQAAPVSDAPAATWASGQKRAPAFSLTDQHGAPVSLATLRGRPVIVTFIDPLCRDYCPIEAQRLTDVANAFPAGAKPAIVAVSVNVFGNAFPPGPYEAIAMMGRRFARGARAHLARVRHPGARVDADDRRREGAQGRAYRGVVRHRPKRLHPRSLRLAVQRERRRLDVTFSSVVGRASARSRPRAARRRR